MPQCPMLATPLEVGANSVKLQGKESKDCILEIVDSSNRSYYTPGTSNSAVSLHRLSYYLAQTMFFKIYLGRYDATDKSYNEWQSELVE